MQTKTNEGRILDKDFREQIDSNISGAQNYLRNKKSMIEETVSEHPIEFVVGAFVGGLLIGALLSKKG